MHCTIILSCFALCTAGTRLTEGVRHNTESLSSAIGIDKDNNVSMSGELHRHHKTIDRQRRSMLWTRLVDHVADALSPFLMKPLLVEGINDMGDFGSKLEGGNFGEISKSANVMRKRYTNKYDNKYSSTGKIGNAYELKKLKSEMARIRKLSEIAEKLEFILIDHLVEVTIDDDKVDTGYIQIINKEGVYSTKTQKIIKRLVEIYPKLRAVTAKDLENIIKTRREMQQLARNFEINRVAKGIFQQRVSIPNSVMAAKEYIEKIVPTNDKLLEFEHNEESWNPPTSKPKTTIKKKVQTKKGQKKTVKK